MFDSVLDITRHWNDAGLEKNMLIDDLYKTPISPPRSVSPRGGQGLVVLLCVISSQRTFFTVVLYRYVPCIYNTM